MVPSRRGRVDGARARPRRLEPSPAPHRLARGERDGRPRRAPPLLRHVRGPLHGLPRPPGVRQPGVRRDLVLVGPAQDGARRRAEDVLPAAPPPVRVRDPAPGARATSSSAGGSSRSPSASSRAGPSPRSRCTRTSARRPAGSSSTRSSRSFRSRAPRGRSSRRRAPAWRLAGAATAFASVATALTLSFVYPDLTPNSRKAESTIQVQTCPEVLGIVDEILRVRPRRRGARRHRLGRGRLAAELVRPARAGQLAAADGRAAPADRRLRRRRTPTSRRRPSAPATCATACRSARGGSPTRRSRRCARARASSSRYLFTRDAWDRQDGNNPIGAVWVTVFRRQYPAGSPPPAPPPPPQEPPAAEPKAPS